ncbi:acyl-CoA dehydrogenase [Nevskia sp.]|uniref:acyl-CoA dehydrogenase n=1 Tax=Nevskia sp. TaxID=1929292 RepID=UPI0025FA4D59|nr:acyl-CoA dehydrogenase [Nevskia sp.]
MATYIAPLRDMAFVIHELLRAPERLRQMPAFAEIDADLLDSAIAGAARFAEGVIAPLNAIGDEMGCRVDAGKVTTPTGFAAAYRQYIDGGWPTLSCATAHGGQGFPALAHTAIVELLCGANQSWTMTPILSHGIYKIVSQHASPALKQLWLPAIVDGSVTTTMLLTEAHCGSDLGLLRSTAVAAPEHDLPESPAYRLSGSKIFISGADHEWTDNIVHMVLARLPDAPPGVRGISLFLVPKRLGDGALNALTVTHVEHKMGLRGSPTCAVSLEGALGWLVGKPHQGLAAMFILMNEARLNTGVQAYSVAQGAYDAALAYARERLQMRVSSGARRPDLPADPIVHHPDVRRMLLTQKARIEGGRMLGYWLALCSDIETHHPNEAERADAADLLALLTPVAKAFLSSNAFDDANLALQVLGGHGYLRDHGIEQRVRDVRVAQIYEGTNGVQARDLVSRKILGDGGVKLGRLLTWIRHFLATQAKTPAMTALVGPIGRLADAFEAQAHRLADVQKTDRDAPDTAAHDMLQALGHLCFGYLFARAAAISLPQADDADPFHAAKLATAQFYVGQLMPQAFAHLEAARASAQGNELGGVRLDEARLFGAG